MRGSLGKKLANYKKAYDELAPFVDAVLLPQGAKFGRDENILALCRLARFLYLDFNKYTNGINQVCAHLGYTAINPTHLMVKGPTPDTVRVFVNLPINPANKTFLQTLNPYNGLGEVFPDLLKDYETALEDPRKAVGWQGFKRAWTRLKKSEVLPIARAITRYTDAVKMGFSDHYIRSIAEAVEENYKPVEIKWADTPEDFIVMYGAGPSSCMNCAKPGDRAWGFLISSYKVHPCSFFAYCPDTRGAYIVRNGKVAARCIVYRKADGKWYAGRMYASSGGYLTQFQEALSREGIKELDCNMFDHTVEFEIPAIKHGTDYIMPLPFFDVWQSAVDQKFDKEKKVFKIKIDHTRNRDAGNVQTNATTGYIVGHVGEAELCSHCGNRCRTPIRPQDANMVLCSQTCARAEGFIGAMRSDGIVVWVRQTPDLVRDMGINGRFYTNIEAAIACGARPWRHTLTESEEEMYSASQYRIQMGGKVYATDPLFIERLQNKRMAYMPSGADCWVGPKEDPAQLPKPLNVKKQRNVAYNLYQGKDYPDIIDKEIVIPDAWKKKFDDLSKFKGFTSLDIEAQFRGIGSVMYYNRATGEPGIIHVHREEVVNL